MYGKIPICRYRNARLILTRSRAWFNHSGSFEQLSPRRVILRDTTDSCKGEACGSAEESF
jgi:hypothetical protein